jgi:O-antigen ligase
MSSTSPAFSVPGLYQPRRPARPVHTPATQRRAYEVKAVVRWALYAFVLLLPFESPNRILVPYDITTVMGFVFLGATLINPRGCYRRIPAPYWCFFIYLYVFGVTFVLNGAWYAPDPEVRKLFILVTQPLLISIAACNMMRDDRIARRALLTLVAGCVGLALLQAAGVADSMVDLGGKVQRATVLGQNPNRTSRLLGTGLLVVIGLTYGRERDGLRPRMIAWAPAALLLMAMIRSGSRGALLATGLGLLAFSLSGKTVEARIRNAAAMVVALLLAVTLALESEVMRARIELAESGNLAKREQIFPTAFAIFAEKPMLGWGPVANQYELGLRLPEHLDDRRDTHNLLLEVFTSTGVLGGIPFFLGLGLCFVGAWKVRRGLQGTLPLALMTMILAGNMSGNFLAFKIQWLMMGYVIAASTFHLRASAVTARGPVGKSRPAVGVGSRPAASGQQ